MATASGRSRPRHTRLGARLQQVRRSREWLQDPFRTTRKNMAMRRELLREARGGIGDLGKFIVKPATSGYQRMQRRGEARFGAPASSRDAKKHAKAKAAGQTAVTQKAASVPQPEAKTVPASPVTSNGHTPARSSSTMSQQHIEQARDSNEEILKQLNKASNNLPGLQLTHAHLFEHVTMALGDSSLMIADAIREMARQIETIPMHRKLAQQYDELADHIAEAAQHTKQIRKDFRSIYEDRLYPDSHAPPPEFFHGATT